MVVAVVFGLMGSYWLWDSALDHTLAAQLPPAWPLAVSALFVLGFGWLIGTVAPRVGAGVAIGLLPGLSYASFSLDRVDRDRAASLVVVGIAVLAVAIGCSLEVHRHPTNGRGRGHGHLFG